MSHIHSGFLQSFQWTLFQKRRQVHDGLAVRWYKKRYFYLPHENRGRGKGNHMIHVISRLQEFV